MANGWIIIDKPGGESSAGALRAIRRALREGGYGKIKLGHGGTLDPMASGVLPVALGEATKLTGRLLDASKIYEFTIRFGAETDTLDAEGDVVERSDARPTLAAVEAVLPRFIGEIEQIPPAFSALKLGGRRAYELARAGEEVKLKARKVEIFELRTSSPQARGRSLDEITLIAHVSKGTYVRSLARDIAHALDCLGHVTMLRRTRAGPFALSEAISLDKACRLGQGAALEDIVLPLEAGLDGIPALSLDPGQARRVRQGQVLAGIAADDGLYLARGEDRTPLALARIEGGKLRVVRGFNL